MKNVSINETYRADVTVTLLSLLGYPHPPKNDTVLINSNQTVPLGLLRGG